MTRATSGSPASRLANAGPGGRATPGTRMRRMSASLPTCRCALIGEPCRCFRAAQSPRRMSLLVAALNTRPLQQFAVLLLRHALAALLDDRPHRETSLDHWDLGTCWAQLPANHACSPCPSFAGRPAGTAGLPSGTSAGPKATGPTRWPERRVSLHARAVAHCAATRGHRRVAPSELRESARLDVGVVQV